jgi:hypothetical protein
MVITRYPVVLDPPSTQATPATTPTNSSMPGGTCLQATVLTNVVELIIR